MQKNPITLTLKQSKEALPVLRGARKLLVTKGWCQGVEWESKDGSFNSEHKDRFCAYGALIEVSNSTDERKVWYRALGTMAAKRMGYNYGSVSNIVTYNDDVANNKRQVLGLFDATITAVRKRIQQLRRA